MSSMNFHPYAEIFPLIDDADFDELTADIKAHGLREPIWLYQEQILDGRNRYMASCAAKVEPQYRQFKGDNAAALAFVVSVNMRRRHLNESQRAMAAARIANLSKGANQHSEGVPIGPSSKMTGASERSTKRARKVLESGSKQLQRAVDNGEISVSKAASVVDRPKPQQLKAAQEKPHLKPIEVAPAPEFDLDGYEPEDDEAYKQSVENVMMADDKLAAMRAELEQAHREIQALKSSRDHYQSQAGEAVRLVKSRDREIEKLKRDLAKAKGEFVGLGAERLNS